VSTGSSGRREQQGRELLRLIERAHCQLIIFARSQTTGLRKSRGAKKRRDKGGEYA
jgi:hypothetical protein